VTWRDGTIGDFVVLQRGHDLVGAEQKPGDVPVIGSAGPNGSHNIAIAKGPGVTIGRSGGSIGRVTYVPTDFWPHNTCIYVTNFKGNHPRFVAYLLSRVKLAQLNSGAAQPSLNRNFVYGVRIRYPDRLQQERIASTLEAYDDLIENNRRRIHLLEQSARLLYREWFVHLRFPGHEHIHVVNGVPDGWKRKTIGAVTDFLSRGISPSYDDDAAGLVINQKCIRERVLSLDKARRQSKTVPPEKLIKLGDVLVNSTGEGTLGRVAQVITDIPNCTVDSHVTIARPSTEVGRNYFGVYLASIEDLLARMGRGATNQTELSRQDIADVELIVPSAEIGAEFEAFAEQIFRQIAVLLEKIKKLCEARDLLLPRLMSGEIAV